MVSRHELAWLVLILSLLMRGEPAAEAGKKPDSDNSDGDTLPPGAITQLRNKHSNSKGATYGLAFAPDARWLMVTGDSPEVCLLDRVTGKRVKSFSVGVRGSVGRASLSRDGRLLAVLVDSGPTLPRLHVWEVESGRERWRRGTEELNLQVLCFSPDCRTLAVAGRQTVRLCDVAAGKETRLLATQAEATRLGGEEDVLEIAFSPDGKLLASGNRGGRIHVWDVARGKSVRVLGPPPGSGTQFAVCSLCFSSTGDLLACGQNSRILVWDTLVWSEIAQLGEHDGGVFSLGFSPDGRTLATGCRDAHIRLWEVATWRKYKQFKGHTGPVWHTKFSPDGRLLATGGQDGNIYLWDAYGLATEGMPEHLSAAKLEELWRALRGNDAVCGQRAVTALAAAPKDAVPFMKEQLRPATVGAAQVERLLADLNADSFVVRDKASVALLQLGKAAQPSLNRLLSDPPSEEVRRRVGNLLARLEKEPPPPEFLLAVRATAILEIVDSAAARDVLQHLAKGAPGAILTEQAKGSLGRLARRSGKICHSK